MTDVQAGPGGALEVWAVTDSRLREQAGAEVADRGITRGGEGPPCRDLLAGRA